MRTANLKIKDRGGEIMRRFMKRINRHGKGFTLVELLVVIGILGILAAVVLLNVTGVIGSGEEEVEESELVIIQTAMDTMMAKNDLTAVTATSSTNDMSGFPTGNALYPNYLRMATTSANYSCSTTGLVTQH
jgi:type IV pilus assembly protein PilA